MQKRWALILSLVALALAIGNIGYQLGDKGYNETAVALAYACGFRAGQIATAKANPSQPANALTPPGGSCPEMQELAAKHGFRAL